MLKVRLSLGCAAVGAGEHLLRGLLGQNKLWEAPATWVFSALTITTFDVIFFFLGTPESKHAAEMSQLSTVRQRELSMCHVLPSNRKPWQANAS